MKKNTKFLMAICLMTITLSCSKNNNTTPSTTTGGSTTSSGTTTSSTGGSTTSNTNVNSITVGSTTFSDFKIISGTPYTIPAYPPVNTFNGYQIEASATLNNNNIIMGSITFPTSIPPTSKTINIINIPGGTSDLSRAVISFFLSYNGTAKQLSAIDGVLNVNVNGDKINVTFSNVNTINSAGLPSDKISGNLTVQ